VPWYDEVLPQVTDIKIIAGALEAELSIRRGNLIGQEGELRGSEPGTNNREVQSYSLSNFTNVQKKKRSEDRLIAAQAPAVRTYVKNSIKQNKVPTRRGVLATAYMSRGRDTRTPAAKPLVNRPRGESKDRLYQALGKLAAQDRALSDGEIHDLSGMSASYVHHVAPYIPWLRRTKTADGVLFTIDTELREICEGKRPRPQLHGASLSQELRTLRNEIKRRRDERDLYVRRSNWDHLTARAKFLVELVTWLEGELERVATLL
jgi:hypothetical protein